jgi:lipopolysaccharide/colanic/teichoic acid biosynthesis glycosyltransferase
MTLSPILANGLRPHRVPVHFQRTSADDLREYVERLRMANLRNGRLAAVVAIDVAQAELARDGARRHYQLLERLDANWAHENAIDWLDGHRLGIVLPDTPAAEAREFAEQICLASDIPVAAVTVYGRDVIVSDHENGLAPLDALYVQRTPRWKRTADIIAAACMLLLTLPILIAASLLVKLSSRGPVFFTQWRVGRGGRPFCILKLRTMRHDADDQKNGLRKQNEQDGLGFKISEDPRVTAVGRWLRRTSIDELPQLINVLKGEMSLVGPRPLPCSDWKPNHGWICRRHDVTPGITCTWQVSGRLEIGFDEWMQMDIDYVDSVSPLLDLALMLRTLPAVLSQRGAT